MFPRLGDACSTMSISSASIDTHFSSTSAPSSSISPHRRGYLPEVGLFIFLEEVIKVIGGRWESVSSLRLILKFIVSYIHGTKLDPIQELPGFAALYHVLPVIKKNIMGLITNSHIGLIGK